MLAWMRSGLVAFVVVVVVVVVVGGGVVGSTACMKTEHVTVPLAYEPGASCVETCRELAGWKAFQCLRACPDATISDGDCVVPPPACAERRVVSGRALATGVGLVALPLLAVFVWYVVLDAGPSD
jgi:hypothetical protein